MTEQENFFEILGNIKEFAEQENGVKDDKEYRSFLAYLEKLPKKIEFADAVCEETGADIDDNEIEHQLGSVWVGDVTITGIETEEL